MVGKRAAPKPESKKQGHNSDRPNGKAWKQHPKVPKPRNEVKLAAREAARAARREEKRVTFAALLEKAS